MQIPNTSKLVTLCLITACSIGGLVACNSSDYRSSDSSNASDSASNSSAVKTDAAAAGDTTAAVGTAKAAHKKGRATIMMPAGNSDAAGNKDMIVKDKEGVYSKVQVMPEFPGGQTALADYVNNHVEYPQQAIDENTTGTVKVSFVVDEQGRISQARLINDQGSKLGHGLDEEALRVVNNMPSWKPGKVKGKNVKTRLELPINFQFES